MSPNIRIIIADDSIISLEVLRNQMYSQGYIDNCEFCHNGQEAIKKFTEVISQGLTVGLMLLDF